MTTNIFTPAPVASMVPVVFDGCFGWFHSPRPGLALGPAILLCSGTGQDFSNAYRPFRLLADHLAKAGYPSLRFDYLGTGDSADADNVNLWNAWQESILLAASWLRKQAGAEQLLLIGLRIGGTLAAMAAARQSHIAGLVLIEPCLTGRSYVAQLVTEARLRSAIQSDGGIEVGELQLTPECQAQMRAAELANLFLPPTLPVAVFSRAPAEKILTRLMPWQKQNVNLTCHDLGGLDAILRPSHHGGEPELEPAPLLDWLLREIPAKASPPPTRPPTPEAFFLPDCMETVLRFGAAWQLTGILCRPTLSRFPGFAVLICNAGGTPRHGFARFGVEFARTLAKAGIASLRFDFAGLGDSIRYNGEIDLQTDVFTEDRSADIRDAVDALEALDFHSFALHGLCSGAYHATRGACVDPRISHLLAVNLPWFSLRHERPGPGSVAQSYIDTLASRNVTAMYLFGEADAGLKSFEWHFGTRGNRLPLSSNIQLRAMPGLDHELTAGWMRKIVAEQMINFLQETWSLTAEGEPRYGHA